MNLGSLIDDFIDQAGTSIITTKGYPSWFKKFRLQISFGKGNPARVPWIAFLKGDNQIRSGIYPILLFYKEHKVLVLAFGISSFSEPTQQWVIPESKITIGKYFAGKGILKVQYASSFYYSSYPILNLDYDSLLSDIEEVLVIYAHHN